MPRSIVSAWITPRRLEDVETLFETLEAAFGPGLTAFELIGRTPLESLSAVTGMTPPSSFRLAGARRLRLATGFR